MDQPDAFLEFNVTIILNVAVCPFAQLIQI